jgi:hypothetical protein
MRICQCYNGDFWQQCASGDATKSCAQRSDTELGPLGREEAFFDMTQLFQRFGVSRICPDQPLGRFVRLFAGLPSGAFRR